MEGDGLVALSQIRHLVTDPASGGSNTLCTTLTVGAGEGITEGQFNKLVERVAVTEDGLVRVADLVTLIQQN